MKRPDASDAPPVRPLGSCRIVPKARKGKLQVEDLPLPSAMQAEPCYDELKKNWEDAVQTAEKSGKPPKLMKVGAGWPAVRRHSKAGGSDLLPGLLPAHLTPHQCRWLHAVAPTASALCFCQAARPSCQMGAGAPARRPIVV